jgi:hypothetical protein
LDDDELEFFDDEDDELLPAELLLEPGALDDEELLLDPGAADELDDVPPPALPEPAVWSGPVTLPLAQAAVSASAPPVSISRNSRRAVRPCGCGVWTSFGLRPWSAMTPP